MAQSKAIVVSPADGLDYLAVLQALLAKNAEKLQLTTDRQPPTADR